MNNENFVKIGNAIYPYSFAELRGEKRLVIQLEVGRYNDGRKRYKRVYGKTEEDLIKRLKIALKQNVVIGVDITIEQMALSVLREKRLVVKPTSYDRLESIVYTHIIKDLGKRKLDYFTFQNIQRYLNEKAISGNTRTGKGMSRSTIQKLVSIFRDMGRWAYLNEHLECNPMVDLKIPPTAAKTKEKKIMTLEELQTFIEVLNMKDNKDRYLYEYRNAMLFMIHTGLRSTEVFGLMKDMVDLERHYIYISRDRIKVRRRTPGGERLSGYKTVVAEYTKNDSFQRMVPLNDYAYEILVEAMNSSNSKLVFPNTKGKPVNPCTFSKSFKCVCKRAGVEITPHALRHTFATLVINNTDLKIEELAKILGHSSTRTTYSTYLHQQANKQSELGQRINTLLQ